MKDIVALPKLYVEDRTHRMERTFLTDEVYEQAIRAMIVVCTDAVIINRSRKTIYLAKRAVKPMQGLWWIGGRRLAGETALGSMNRCFKRETGLDVHSLRFKFVDTTEYLWKDREQTPQHAGSHGLSHTFAVELSDTELEQAKSGLEKKEYETGYGLGQFSRYDLLDAQVHTVILDIYDKIFS